MGGHLYGDLASPGSPVSFAGAAAGGWISHQAVHRQRQGDHGFILSGVVHQLLRGPRVGRREYQILVSLKPTHALGCHLNSHNLHQ